MWKELKIKINQAFKPVSTKWRQKVKEVTCWFKKIVILKSSESQPSGIGHKEKSTVSWQVMITWIQNHSDVLMNHIQMHVLFDNLGRLKLLSIPPIS